MESFQHIAVLNFNPDIWQKHRVNVEGGSKFDVYILVDVEEVKAFVMERVFVKLANDAAEYDNQLGIKSTQIEVTNDKF